MTSGSDKGEEIVRPDDLLAYGGCDGRTNESSRTLRGELSRSISELCRASDLSGVFGIVTLWREKAVAEHENVARIVSAASLLGLRAVPVDPSGTPVEAADQNLRLDFILNLHYETPKSSPVHSYGVLWNPVDFYFDRGFETFTANQLSHDGFVSAGSRSADDIVHRVRGDEFARGTLPVLNHSLADPIFSPRRLENRRLFYCGINWELITGRPARHGKLLQALDRHDLIDIHGPEEVEGVRPWRGYRNYRGPLPFDGRSLIEAASRCGAVLVLSSQAHIRSDLMSNRLFEALAAGAVVLGDDHPFLRRRLANSYLNVCDANGDISIERCLSHVEAMNRDPDWALELAWKGQNRFLAEMTLDRQLADLYAHHAQSIDRVRRLKVGLGTKRRLSVCIIPARADASEVLATLAMLEAQDVAAGEILVAIDGESALSRDEALLTAERAGRLRLVDVRIGTRYPFADFGAILGEVIDVASGDSFCALFGGETLFPTYVAALLAGTESQAQARVAALEEETDENGSVVLRILDAPRHGERPDALGAGAVRIEAYAPLRPLLDHVDIHHWQRLMSRGMAGPCHEGHVPALRLDTSLSKSRKSSAVEGGRAPLLRPEQIRDLVQSYARRGARGSHWEKGGDTATDISSQLSADTINRLPEDQRQRLSAALFRSLPLPRPLHVAIARAYRWYARMFGRSN